MRTIEDDIHSVGKDIFKVLAQIYGFTVHDLGVNIPATKFLAAINEFRPDIVGFFCLIASVYDTVYDTMRDTIAFLKRNIPNDLSPRVYIIGGKVNKIVYDTVGGDYWADDAMKGVRLCQKIMDSDI